VESDPYLLINPLNETPFLSMFPCLPFQKSINTLENPNA